jgi:hypothetical protein
MNAGPRLTINEAENELSSEREGQGLVLPTDKWTVPGPHRVRLGMGSRVGVWVMSWKNRGST